jgi:hypothetical protein
VTYDGTYLTAPNIHTGGSPGVLAGGIVRVNGGVIDLWTDGRIYFAGQTVSIYGASNALRTPNDFVAGGQFVVGGPGSFGGGTGPMVFLANDTIDPTANPTGGGILFVSSGVLKARTPDGTVTQIAPSPSAIRNATRKPVSTDGNTGDYWLDTADDILYGPKVAGGLPGGPQYLAPQGGSPSADTGTNQHTGFTFTVSVDCWLVGASLFTITGQPVNTWWIDLWDMASTTAPIFQDNPVNVPTGATLAESQITLGPVRLNSGKTYMLSVTNTSGGRSWNQGVTPTAGPVTVTGSYYNSDSNPNTVPATAWGGGFYVGARAVVQNNDATQTWPIALFGIPVGGTAGQHLVKVDGTDYNVAWGT